MSQLPSQLQSAAMMQPDKRPFSYLPSGGLTELQKRQTENRSLCSSNLSRASPSANASSYQPAATYQPLQAQQQQQQPNLPQSYASPGQPLVRGQPAGPQDAGYGSPQLNSTAFRPINEASAFGRPLYCHPSGLSSSQPASGCQSPQSEHYREGSYQDSLGSISPQTVGGGGAGNTHFRSKYGSPTFGWSPQSPEAFAPPVSDVVAYVLQPDGTMAAIRCPTTQQAAVLAAIQENPGVRRSQGPPRRQVSSGSGSGKGSSVKTQGLSYKMLQALTISDETDRGNAAPADSYSAPAETREETPIPSTRGIRIITRQSSRDSSHSERSQESFTDF